jgi:hypothetical protein
MRQTYPVRLPTGESGASLGGRERNAGQSKAAPKQSHFREKEIASLTALAMTEEEYV